MISEKILKKVTKECQKDVELMNGKMGKERRPLARRELFRALSRVVQRALLSVKVTFLSSLVAELSSIRTTKLRHAETIFERNTNSAKKEMNENKVRKSCVKEQKNAECKTYFPEQSLDLLQGSPSPSPSVTQTTPPSVVAAHTPRSSIQESPEPSPTVLLFQLQPSNKGKHKKFRNKSERCSFSVSVAAKADMKHKIKKAQRSLFIVKYGLLLTFIIISKKAQIISGPFLTGSFVFVFSHFAFVSGENDRQ
jgi:hypothetical protein